MGKDFLMDDQGNFLIRNGDFVIDDSELQEAGEILSSMKGEFKEDPLIGADLLPMIKSKAPQSEIELAARIALARDGKDWNALKKKIELKTLRG